MKGIIFTSLILLILEFANGQVSTTQVEGFLEVFHPLDTTSLYIGNNSGRNTDVSFIRGNTFVGSQAGEKNTTGSANSFYGECAGASNTIGIINSFFGQRAGKENISGSANSFFGYSSGKQTNDGSSNSFYGSTSGFSNTSGSLNSFFGAAAGTSNTLGIANSFFGESAGQANTVGSSNIFLGVSAGLSSTEGSENTFVGSQSGTNNVSGYRNTLLGNLTGFNLTTQCKIIAIGDRAGPTNLNPTDSMRLYIDVEQTDAPLIYGDFHGDTLRINGVLDVTNGISGVFNGTSDKARKDNVIKINSSDILDKVSKLSITEWQYKGSEERHIGPMAQDFHKAFGLGKGMTTIATVDADGVALAAIKALKEENDELKNMIRELQDRMAKLEPASTATTSTALHPQPCRYFYNWLLINHSQIINDMESR